MDIFVCLHLLMYSFLTKSYSCMTPDERNKGVTLADVVDKLEKFAHTSLAESWDNVGLLVEPYTPQMIKTILLTNDLTEDVLEEALLVSAELIIAYHPIIFVPLKRVTNAKWKERVVAKCLANNIAVYSPHTTWDIVQGGINDWLASAFECSQTKPLAARKMSKPTNILTIESAKKGFFNELTKILPPDLDFKLLLEEPIYNSSNYKLTIRCHNEALKKVIPKLQDLNSTNFYVHPESSHNEEVTGVGRHCKLRRPISIRSAVETLKKHLGISNLQLALARNATLDDSVRTIAFAAGSGGTILKTTVSDLKVTGEASHHDILEMVHNGASIILTSHSNSERGFLLKFTEMFASMLNNASVNVIVSSKDADPLQIY